MSLLDKLRHSKQENIPAGKPAVHSGEAAVADIEAAIADRCPEIDLNGCIKLPFEDIGRLGALFAGLIPSLQTITVEGNGYIPVNMNAGDVLKCAKDGLNWGAHITTDGKSVMTKWAKAGATQIEMPINPAMLMMAAMLANVEKKLDTIQETQLNILSFLEQDKQAEQQSNLNVLTDILTGYKFNLDKAQFLQNSHMKVLDIKQASEKNVLFYREQIASTIRKIPAVYLDQVIGDAVSKLVKQFKNYRMALYLFAFSSYLDAILLGNFNSEYLEQIAGRVDQYNEAYHSQFSKCLDMVKKLCAASVETKVSAALGSVSKTLGKWIGAAPVIKDAHVDEWLQESGHKLLDSGKVKVEKLSTAFAANEDNGSEIFVENIRNVSLICNQTRNIIVGNDAVYLAAEAH